MDRSEVFLQLLFVEGRDPDFPIVFAVGDVDAGSVDDKAAGENNPFFVMRAFLEVVREDGLLRHLGDGERGLGRKGVEAHKIVPGFCVERGGRAHLCSRMEKSPKFSVDQLRVGTASQCAIFPLD
jgi:hypothetical protein